MIFIFFLIAVTWQGQEARLTVHYENGLTLADAHNSENGMKTQVFWYFPFERLKMSADDGHHLLWLDFGGEDGEQVGNESKTYMYYSQLQGELPCKSP